MNWKKLFLTIAGLGLAFILFVSIALGLLAAAGAATVAAVARAVDEAGGLTITDGRGETFSLDVSETGGIRFSDSEGEAFAIDVNEGRGITFRERDGDTATIEVRVPRVTVTEGGRSRVIVPDVDEWDLPRIEGRDGRLTVHVPRHDTYWPDMVRNPLSFLFRATTVLFGLGFLVVGGYLLLKNRQQAPKEPKSV